MPTCPTLLETADTAKRLAASTTQLTPADLLTDEQVAELLNVSTKTLATWRSTGRYALPFLRIGARIRYRRQDVATWLESRLAGTAAPAQEVA